LLIAPFYYQSTELGSQALMACLVSTVIKSADHQVGSSTILPYLSHGELPFPFLFYLIRLSVSLLMKLDEFW